MMEGAAANAARQAQDDGARPAGPVDADADIFGEAGRDYEPEIPSSTNGTVASYVSMLDLADISQCTYGMAAISSSVSWLCQTPRRCISRTYLFMIIISFEYKSAFTAPSSWVTR